MNYDPKNCDHECNGPRDCVGTDQGCRYCGCSRCDVPDDIEPNLLAALDLMCDEEGLARLSDVLDGPDRYIYHPRMVVDSYENDYGALGGVTDE